MSREASPVPTQPPTGSGNHRQNVSLLLRGVKADQIQRGQVVAAVRSLAPEPVCDPRGWQDGRLGCCDRSHRVMHRAPRGTESPGAAASDRMRTIEGVPV